MTDTITPAQLPEMDASRAQKEVTFNESMLRVGTYLGGVLSASVAIAPSTPADAAAYIVPEDASGIWASHDKQFAIWYSGWRYIDPFPGLLVYVADVGQWWTYGAISEAWGVYNPGAGVQGPGSSTAGNIPLFANVDGNEISDSGKSIADLRKPTIQAITSAATVTPTFDDDMVKVTAQAAALALANPTGTPIPGAGLAIRIKDNGTARAISFGTQYRAVGVTLPATTVIGKTLYLGLIYNADDTKWDVVAVAQEA